VLESAWPPNPNRGKGLGMWDLQKKGGCGGSLIRHGREGRPTGNVTFVIGHQGDGGFFEAARGGGGRSGVPVGTKDKGFKSILKKTLTTVRAPLLSSGKIKENGETIKKLRRRDIVNDLSSMNVSENTKKTGGRNQKKKKHQAEIVRRESPGEGLTIAYKSFRRRLRTRGKN